MDLQPYESLPLQIDPQTKAITTTQPNPPATLTAELQALNTLHRSLVTSAAPNGVPPPPLPVDPKRSAQITKMREAGNTSFRKQSYGDAIRLYTLGIEMATGRPPWEPSGLVREELSGLYANRAQAQMALRAFAEGAVDALCSVELKKVGNAKAWWRRGRCLLEMGRVDEAKAWVLEAIQFEGKEAELVALLEEIGREETGAKR